MDNTASREGFDIYSGKYVVGKHIPAGDYQVLYVDLPETYYMDDTYDIKIYRSAGEGTKPVLLEGYSIICKHRRIGCIELVEGHTLVIQPKVTIHSAS